jgi:hypothetical protein
MTEPTPEPFWTFVPQGMFVKSGEGLSVTGWFFYGNVIHEAADGGGSDPALRTQYLTPADDPIKIIIPSWLLDGKPIGEFKLDDVVNILETKVFNGAFKPIPKAPSELPMHRVPPGRRKSVEDMLRHR